MEGIPRLKYPFNAALKEYHVKMPMSTIIIKKSENFLEISAHSLDIIFTEDQAAVLSALSQKKTLSLPGAVCI